ncbi:MAG TPA: hypothetical protein VFG10_08660 [Saprospiraceae bacterium]|nr:hypothetical protein [Saprospiraceae bacterium]
MATFAEFIEFFPLRDLPFSLLPDISQIPSDSLPLPAIMLEAYILPFEGDEVDEYTEYIPYGRIMGTKGFEALIYWKAGILKYEFILATYGLDGHLISHAIIAGLRSDDEGILHSVAIINTDMSITIAEGLTPEDDHSLDLNNTSTYQMAILPDGFISYDMNEEVKEE